MERRNIPHKVSYRNIKYPRLEFITGELFLILPCGYKPEMLLDKHKAWVTKKSDFIKECLSNIKGKKLTVRTDKEFKTVINSLVMKTSQELNVGLNKVYFRKMKTKWASLSTKKNLTVNMLMKHLPTQLIKYVILHETAHLIEKRHNERFWEEISKHYKNYQEKERELFIHWFLVAKNVGR